MGNIGNSVTESELGDSTLFNIVQGARYSLSSLENIEVPKLYMLTDNYKTVVLNLNPILVHIPEVIQWSVDFLGTCKNYVPRKLTVQSLDSDKSEDKYKLIKIVCKLGKNKGLVLQTK